MPNTFTAARLASGQLPSTLGNLYTVPASTVAYIKFFSLVNTSNSLTETISVYVNDGTANRNLTSAPLTLGPNQSARIIEIGEALNLNAGDIIKAVTTDANTVDFIITGITEV